ncbi:MAG TPA: tyrosine-type recombinase/integrase [Candidatus Paceibacterota bacterium]
MAPNDRSWMNPKRTDEMRTVKRRKVRLPKTLEKDEMIKLLNAPNRSAITGLRNRCMLELMYRSGLRVSEVCNLRVRDVNLKKREIYVWDGKGGDRTTGYPPGTQLDLLLEAWLTRKKFECQKSEYFFCTIDGGKVHTRYVQQMIKRMAKRAGLEMNITPHMLRHTFATEFISGGGPVHLLQMLLGHKHISTTQIYMHARPEDALAALRRMG